MTKTVKITEQELKFVHDYVSNGFKGTKAYESAFEIKPKDDKERNKIGGRAYRLLKTQIIQDAIDTEEGSFKATAREMDMGRKEILGELNKILFGSQVRIDKKGEQIEIEEDGKTKIAAINTLCKLTGDFSPERKEVDFSPSRKIDTKNLSKEEIKAMQESLLNEM